MTKPKFTPDPPPYLQGMDVDKAFPLFVDWAMRQNNRIEDWWPKDFEERIQALERLAPYCIGEWIIADAASLSFQPEICDGSTMCPSDTTWTVAESMANTTAFEQLGYCVQVDSDMGYLAMGGSNGGAVRVFQDQGGGTWAIANSLTLPPGGPSAFGRGFDYSETTGVMVVGASGENSLDGLAYVYTGSNSAGWTYTTTVMSPPIAQSDGRFGDGVGMSADGQVLAIGAPGTDATSVNRQRVFIYDYNGDQTFTYRNAIDGTDYSGGNEVDQGFGRKIELSSDGAVLVACDPDHDIGATGAVYVYDDVAGTYTLRQEIPLLNLAANSIPGSYDGNNAKFGSDAMLSDDLRSLLIAVPNYDNAGAERVGIILIYQLNAVSNLYEYCGYFTGTTDAIGFGFSVDGVFDQSLKKLAVGILSYDVGANNAGGAQIWDGSAA